MSNRHSTPCAPRIGDTIHTWPAAFEHWSGAPKTIPGKIVSINRRHRHYRVEFQVSGRIIGESFKFDDGIMYR